MRSSIKNNDGPKNKKINQIINELEICKAEIKELKQEITHLKKNKEPKDNKFKCIKDIIIWTNEKTNNKDIFRIPDGFNVNNIYNIDIDKNGLLMVYWETKGKINKVKITEELYYFLKGIMPEKKTPIENLRLIFEKINCKRIVTDEMQRVWDVLIEYRNMSLKTRIIYIKAKVSKQTAHNHLNLFTQFGLVSKIFDGRWQYKDLYLDSF